MTKFFKLFSGVHPEYAQTLISMLLISALLIPSPASYSAEIEVPELGDTSSSVISREEEYELGQKILKLYRSQVPTSSDPIIYSYLENLITELAAYSELDNKSFDLIVIETPVLNAFAAPGRVVGVNTGAFLKVESEDQLASILTHELACLSQRHIARQRIAQKNATIPTMAGLLAGIVLAAAGGGDAGIAAISATQALALDNQLRYSRSFEQEADRAGIQNLVKAGRNPEAAAEMFEVMLKQYRYTRRPPEFLSTHPVTESRIADARSRAMQYPAKEYADNLDFHLVSARVRLHYETTPQQAVKRFQSEIDGQSLSQEASRYGLTLALIATGETTKARKELDILLQQRPEKTIYLLAAAQLDAKEKNYTTAINSLENLLKYYPNNYAINIQLAEILMEAGEYRAGEILLNRLVRLKPKSDYAWYLLAETNGLVGNILAVHLSRAEYFILTGIYDRAELQLQNALRLTKDTRQVALIEQRLIDIRALQKDSDF